LTRKCCADLPRGAREEFDWVVALAIAIEIVAGVNFQ
jgi:hypothetical protein